MQAKIRKVEALPHFASALDAVEVKLGNELEETAGWRESGSKWIGIPLSTNRQTPLGVSGIDQEIAWDRTTFAKERGKWKLVEMAMPLNLMMEQEEKVEGLKQGALVSTILSAGEHGPEDLGFEALRRLNVSKCMSKTLQFKRVDWRWEVRTLMKLKRMASL